MEQLPQMQPEAQVLSVICGMMQMHKLPPSLPDLLPEHNVTVTDETDVQQLLLLVSTGEYWLIFQEQAFFAVVRVMVATTSATNGATPPGYFCQPIVIT